MTALVQMGSNASSFRVPETSLYDAPMAQQPRPLYVPQVSRAYGNEYTLGWSRGGLSGGDSPAQTIIAGGAYDPYLQSTLFPGGGGYYKFTGVTKDSGGSPLGSAVVQLFHTTDDAIIQEATSDVSGNYYVDSPYADNHYIVAYKAGSPDVAGSTINTLTGTL